jgi:hypothetical protein
MTTRLERDQRWAKAGDDADYLSPGPPVPRGAGVLALIGLLCVAVLAWATGDGATPAAPAQPAAVRVATAIDGPTFALNPGRVYKSPEAGG